MNEPQPVNVSIDRATWKAAKLISVQREITLKEYIEQVLQEAMRKEVRR